MDEYASSIGDGNAQALGGNLAPARSEPEVTMDDKIDLWLMSYTLKMQAITKKLRNMIKGVMPGVAEQIYHGALSYSPGASVFEQLVYLAVEKDYIRLGFNFGSYLPDPNQLLVGEGKRLRHIKIRSIQDAGNPDIKQLVQDAWDNREAHPSQLRKELLHNQESAG